MSAPTHTTGNTTGKDTMSNQTLSQDGVLYAMRIADYTDSELLDAFQHVTLNKATLAKYVNHDEMMHVIRDEITQRIAADGTWRK